MRKEIDWNNGLAVSEEPISITTRKGSVINQSTDKLMGWCKNNRRDLVKKRTSHEIKVYQNMPKNLKRHAITQYPVLIQDHTYFVDLFIAKYNIVIEVDGGYHNESRQRESDAERDRLLASVGLRVYRITNSDVNDDVAFAEFKEMLRTVKPIKATKQIKDIERPFLSNAEYIEDLIDSGNFCIHRDSLLKTKKKKKHKSVHL